MTCEVILCQERFWPHTQACHVRISGHRLVFAEQWKGFSGPVVQISDSLGGTSGRFEVASIIARVFPGYKAFVSKVIAEGIEAEADFPAGPYPADKLHYRGKRILGYETPPQTEGLGTRSRLLKNNTPITGAEILSGPEQELDLTSLAVRLPPGSEDLTQAIVLEAEREAGSPAHGVPQTNADAKP